jgi:hypothetical protein
VLHCAACYVHRFDDAAGVLEQALGNSDSVEHHHTSSSANKSHAADVADLSSDVETLILLSQVCLRYLLFEDPFMLLLYYSLPTR